MQWKRDSESKLALWIHEDDNWVLFNRSKHYKKDCRLSTNNGFATAQEYLRLSGLNIIKLEYLPIEEYNVS